MARFFDKDGKIIRTSTIPKAKSRTAAAREAEKLLNEGVIANAANPDALDYLLKFWTRKSDYVQGRALRGVVLSESYLEINRLIVNKHLGPKIKGKKLLDIDADFMEGLILVLSKEGASPRTINGVLNAVRVPMKYFCKRKRIADPLGIIVALTEYPKERGVLSIEELQKIIALEGESPRVIAGILLAALCGLRLGEACAVMVEDIDREKSILTVQHNFIEKDGLKGPKGSRPQAMRTRQVSLPQPVLAAIDLCISVAPKGARFILWNDRNLDKPVHPSTLQGGYIRILHGIGLDDAAIESRNLVFHGLRHTFVSLQRAIGTPDFVIAHESGHRSLEMLENYSKGAGNVLDFQTAREALEKAIEPKDASAKEKNASGA